MFILFLQNLGMGVGGTPAVYVMADPFAAYISTCTAGAGGCNCV